MVSGFLTSPFDQERMESGEATEMATYSTWLTLSRPSNSRVDSLVLIIGLGVASGAGCDLAADVGQGVLRCGGVLERVGVTDFDIHAEGLHFFDEDVKGLGDAGFEAIVAFDNALVDAGAALHVVGFDGEQFLQG